MTLSPAANAFDTIAPQFDARFGGWHSVAAQRRSVRRVLSTALPKGARVLELGGGTGEDAAWMAEHGFEVLLTDAAPAMVHEARGKLASRGVRAEVVTAEELPSFAREYLAQGGPPFDAVFSNFAPLKCVEDLNPVVRGLAHLIRPRGTALLVLFGCFSPGEMLVEALCGRPRQVLRRFASGPKPARLGGKHFTVTYHRSWALKAAMTPWFRLRRRTGIGVFVPPSAAEPWISGHPHLLKILEYLDRAAERPLAAFGDHILYQFERTETPAP
jgi:ubiquinone/menaquinone biosynthesis C-methylase UbiE